MNILQENIKRLKEEYFWIGCCIGALVLGALLVLAGVLVPV